MLSGPWFEVCVVDGDYKIRNYKLFFNGEIALTVEAV
jgi:hypothetical protein